MSVWVTVHTGVAEFVSTGSIEVHCLASLCWGLPVLVHTHTHTHTLADEGKDEGSAVQHSVSINQNSYSK